jgi:hypothetical protein
VEEQAFALVSTRGPQTTFDNAGGQATVSPPCAAASSIFGGSSRRIDLCCTITVDAPSFVYTY